MADNGSRLQLILENIFLELEEPLADHLNGIAHSLTIFYLQPSDKTRCENCHRNAVVKLIGLAKGSITTELFHCQLCYLSFVTSQSVRLYSEISTECGKALLLAGGFPVDAVEKHIGGNFVVTGNPLPPQKSCPVSQNLWNAIALKFKNYVAF